MKTNKRDIVEQYGIMVSALAHRTVRNTDIAKETAQEVWYEILKGVDSFEGKSELSTWIYTIARRTISRYAANQRIATMPELKEFRDLPEIAYEGEEEQKTSGCQYKI